MSSSYTVGSARMHEDVGADGARMISRSRASCVPVRRWVGSLVAVAAIAVLALAGCADVGDTTAPTVSARFVSAVGATVTLELTVNEPGTLFWVAYVDGSTAPANAAALIADAGKDKNAPIVANSGSNGQAISAAGAVSVPITDLATGTGYDFYATVRDVAGNASRISAKLDISTVPSVSGLTATVASTTGVALAWTNPDPTTDDLKHITVAWAIVGDSNSAGNYTLNSPTEGGQAAYAVTGLQTNSAYRFSLVSVDNANNSSSAATIDQTPRIDGDNDMLIDIRNLDMLSNVRCSLDGSSYLTVGSSAVCATTGGLRCGASGTTACTGYELVRNLDFATAGDYASGSIDNAWRPTNSGGAVVTDTTTATNAGFVPIGTIFSGVFDGNGNSISKLYIRSSGHGGLFEQLSGTVRNLGVVNGAVYNSGSDSGYNIGILAGQTNSGSTVMTSYTTGNVNSGVENTATIGGLIGNSSGTIIASYTTAVVNGGAGSDFAGGIGGSINAGAVIASYATGNVNGGAATDSVGGLAGSTTNSGTIIASYTTGNADAGEGSDNVGNLAGFSTTIADITASYGFGTATGGTVQSSTRPSGIAAGSGKVGARKLTLTTPAGTAVGAQWNAAASNTLGAWDFGSSSQIPALRYADYDGAGTVYNCNQFPGGVCGALIPGQR